MPLMSSTSGSCLGCSMTSEVSVRCSNRVSEGSIHRSVLINSNRSFIPAFRVKIIRSVGSHCGYRITDFRVEPTPKFYHDGFWTCVSRLRNQVSEVVQVVAYTTAALEVCLSFQSIGGNRIRMQWVEFISEDRSEVIPIYKVVYICVGR